MPTHARTQIRERVTTLLNGNTSAGNKVYESRIYPIDNNNLPAILIYTKQEQINEYSISKPRTQFRELNLVIEIYLKSENDIDSQVDSICLEIEKIISNDSTLNGLAKDVVLTNTDINFSDEGEKPIVMANLNYNVTYTVKEHQPETIV